MFRGLNLFYMAEQMPVAKKPKRSSPVCRVTAEKCAKQIKRIYIQTEGYYFVDFATTVSITLK